MLCITRRVGESIHIEGPCIITLVELRRVVSHCRIVRNLRPSHNRQRQQRLETAKCRFRQNPIDSRGVCMLHNANHEQHETNKEANAS